MEVQRAVVVHRHSSDVSKRAAENLSYSNRSSRRCSHSISECKYEYPCADRLIGSVRRTSFRIEDRHVHHFSDYSAELSSEISQVRHRLHCDPCHMHL